MLIDKMEQYFKSIEDKYIGVDVFVYNKIEKNFYNKKVYHPRIEIMIKKYKGVIYEKNLN